MRQYHLRQAWRGNFQNVEMNKSERWGTYVLNGNHDAALMTLSQMGSQTWHRPEILTPTGRINCLYNPVGQVFFCNGFVHLLICLGNNELTATPVYLCPVHKHAKHSIAGPAAPLEINNQLDRYLDRDHKHHREKKKTWLNYTSQSVLCPGWHLKSNFLLMPHYLQYPSNSLRLFYPLGIYDIHLCIDLAECCHT